MKAHLLVAWDFVKEALRFAFVGRGLIGKLSRWIVMGAIAILSLPESPNIAVSIGDHEWHISLYACIFSILLVVWVSISLTVAWERCRSLIVKIDNNLEPDEQHRCFRLSIENIGTGKRQVEVWCIASTVPVPTLPLQMTWMHHDSESPALLQKGRPMKVDIFRIVEGKPGVEKYFSLPGSKHDCPIYYNLPRNEQAKAFFRFSIGERDERWISIVPDLTAVMGYKTTFESPPP